MNGAMIWLFQAVQQAIQAAATQGAAAPTRDAFNAPGSNIARLAATESWHAFYWVIPFILIAFILLVVVMVRFRDKGDGRQPAKFHDNNPLEIAWTIIPVIVVVMVALHSYPVLHIMEYGGNNPAVNVEVVGHQWFWEYKYPQYGIDISNDTLVLPANQVVDLDLTSVDVIHGFYVPGLGIQEDALPGRLTNQWFKAQAGYYKGQCTQLCGVNHSQMLIDVQVLPDNEFQAWLQSHRNQPSAAAAVATLPAALLHLPKTLPMQPAQKGDTQQ
ncbi:MAG TPA: cytochrome c oxidase subunit II [Terriglobales bacterium]|nr:cytochrome c oxidase subunit II [Terriglobales bacterium]